jgi:ubiquinone/menaquinone biosynthesis C-methylase UbiE
VEKKRMVQIFDRQAKQYGGRREGRKLQEWRQSLVGKATGRVLELAVGAGANFPHYPPGVRLTATDFSEAMLQESRKTARRCGLDAEFICSDNEGMAFAEHSFDTVVSTLSLCAYDDPLKVLQNMKRWCRPGGQILLMEHGISPNLPLSLVQKAADPLLYRINGCHHSRDILGLVREAGLSIQRTESYWVGMVNLIWAKPV